MPSLLGLALSAGIGGAAAAADKIRFVTLEFAPFIYGDNQQVAGPGRDVIAAVCAEAKLECSYDIYPWRRAQELMKNGGADGMMVIGRNPKREEWIRFSPPHFRTEYGVFVNADNRLDFSEISQLESLRIGVFAPSNTATQLMGIRDEMAAQGLDPIEIDERPDDASGFRKLAAGRIDAVYSNRDRGRQIVEAEGLADRVRYAGGHQGIFYYAGFARSFPDQGLIDRFDAAWRALFRRGRAQEIIESYGLEPAVLE
jgi:polar amino acid transport system substrate-binding protein